MGSSPSRVPERPDRARTWALVLNFNALALTGECVSRLRKSEQLDAILVIDNGSQEEEGQQLVSDREGEPGVPILLERLPSNHGYAGGMQAGIMFAMERGAELVYLVNNDCWVSPRSVAALCEEMQAKPMLAAAAGPVVHADWVDCGSRLDHIRFRNIREPFPSEARDVEFLPGDAWMLRVAAIEQVGGLDCRLFLVGEEPDWCHRARLQGWRVQVVPGAAVSAHVGGTASKYPAEMTFYVTRNRLWLTRRQAVGYQKAAALLAFLLWEGPRIALGRVLQRDWLGLKMVLMAGSQGLFGDCRWSDEVDEAVAMRVGRLADERPLPRAK